MWPLIIPCNSHHVLMSSRMERTHWDLEYALPPFFFLFFSLWFRSDFFQLLTSLLIWHCLLALPTLRLTHGAGFPACHVSLATLWYLGTRAWSDEKRQISYSTVCVQERQILRMAQGREGCQLCTRHQTALNRPHWHITRTLSSHGSFPGRWIMLREKKHTHTCAHICRSVSTDKQLNMMTDAWIRTEKYTRIMIQNHIYTRKCKY